MRQGLFREDLLHRLNVVRLRLPPLRERREDIAPLARHSCRRARASSRSSRRCSPRPRSGCSCASVPGNVRQLENICHWLTVMAPGQRDRRGATCRRNCARRRRQRRQPAPSPTGGRRSIASSPRRSRAASARRRPARARVREDADPAGAGAHRRPSHGGRAVARLGPQHADAQDPGARARAGSPQRRRSRSHVPAREPAGVDRERQRQLRVRRVHRSLDHFLDHDVGLSRATPAHGSSAAPT